MKKMKLATTAAVFVLVPFISFAWSINWGSDFTMGQYQKCPVGSVMVHSYLTYPAGGSVPNLVAKVCRPVSANPAITWGSETTLGQSQKCPVGTAMVHSYLQYGTSLVNKVCRKMSADSLVWGPETTVGQGQKCSVGTVEVHAYLSGNTMLKVCRDVHFSVL